MNKYLVVLIVGILISSGACRRQHTTRSTGSVRSPSSTSDSTLPVAQLPAPSTDSLKTTSPAQPNTDEARTNVAEIDFRYLTARSKISFKSKTQEIDNASASIRVRQDSLIWLSMSKLGIEAARVLITRDSITIMDKIHREYTVYDFPTLSKQFNVNMNYPFLQALLIGNLPLPHRPAQKIKNGQNSLLLRQSEGNLLVENYIQEDNRKLKKLLVTQQPTNNTVQVAYDDFTSLNTFLFPFTSQLTVDYQSPSDGQFNQTVLGIKYTKVELIDNNPGFPFTIPANYQRRP